MNNSDVCAAIVDGNPQAPFHIVVFPIEKHTLTRLSQYSVQHHDTLVGHLVLVGKVRYIKLTQADNN